MKKFVNFRFVVTLVLAVFANVVTYAQDNVVDEVVWVVGLSLIHIWIVMRFVLSLPNPKTLSSNSMLNCLKWMV